MRAVFTAAAILLAVATGVNAVCPSSLTVSGVTFDPSYLKGKMWGLEEVKDGRPGGAFDFIVDLCAKQPECTGDRLHQGNYYITQLNHDTTTCSGGLFESMTSDLAVRSNDLAATYMGPTGLILANVRISCGGNSALSPLTNSFYTHLDSNTSTTTYTFNFQSNVFCPPPDVVVTEHVSLTWGALFLIGFFGCLLVYVLAAVVFNLCRGMRGSDLAPHPAFWTALPYLFLDGIKFTSAKLLALCGKGDGTFVSSAPTRSINDGDRSRAASSYSAI